MEILTKDNYAISIIDHRWEEIPAVSALYEGVYSVIIDDTLTVTFIQEIKNQSDPWPPEFPANTDTIQTVYEARAVSVLLSKYAVTPDDTQPGRHEQICSAENGNEGKTLIFYVTSHAFRLYSGELKQVSEQMSGIHDRKPLSTVSDMAFMQFLLRNVFPVAGVSLASIQQNLMR